MRIPINLVEKYNKPVPRYTSYPTVPHWQWENPTESIYIDNLNRHLKVNQEICLYIHLPYCENLCTYCGCNKRITKNHKVEEPYIKRILQEWKIYISQLSTTPIIKELHLGGGTPTFFSPESLKELMEGIFELASPSPQPAFSFEAHPNSTTKGHLEVLRTFGFNRISLGVQDVAPEIMKAINRYQTVEQIREVTQYARKIGYQSVNYDIIYGLPYQNQFHIRETIDFIREMKPDRIAFYSYAHVPWKSKGQRAFGDHDFAQGYEKHLLRELGYNLLSEIGYEDIGMDHFALPGEDLSIAHKEGRLHRNFMGYTVSNVPVLIGLGASSISETPEMYVQNEKHIEDYNEYIDQHKLPLIKGHQLSNTDQFFKNVILDLICNERGNFVDILSHTDNKDLVSSRIKELINDNLLSIHEGEIKIHPIGSTFIRNICAAIDPLIPDHIENQLFSKSV